MIPSTLSSADCTFLYNGILTTDNSGIVTTKTSAAFTSIVNAMIIAPNTINGERRNKRNTRFTPFCVWLISLVILVISVDVPTVSISENDSF